MSQAEASIRCGGFPVVMMDARKYPRASGKANSYRCSSGRKYGLAHVLMYRRDVEQLDLASTIDLEFRITGPAPETLSFSGLYFVKAICVGGYSLSPDAVYLVTLADRRAPAAEMSDSGQIQANVRGWAVDPDDGTYGPNLVGTEGATWATLLQAIWETMPTLGAWPGIPVTPADPPDSVHIVGLNSWDALHDLLEKLGCTIAYNPFTNVVSIVEVGAEQNVPTLAGELLYDAAPFESATLGVPETIRVWFHGHYENFGQERDTERDENWTTEKACHFEDVPTGVAGVIAGTIVGVWDDLLAVYGADNNLSNSSELAARAAEVATAWVQANSSPRGHGIVTGLRSDIVCGERIREVIWKHVSFDENGSRIGFVTEFVGHAPVASPNCDGPAIDAIKPSILNRRLPPTFPRLPNMVQVFHSLGTVGTSVDANADGLHAARVVRWVAGDMQLLEDCWLRFVDDHDNRAGDVSCIDGDFFYARLSGMQTSGGLQLPIYLARKGDAVEGLVRFELTGALALSGHAKAETLEYSGGSWVTSGNEIEVYDWYGSEGMWSEAVGYRGFCIRRPGAAYLDTTPDPDEIRPVYDIVWMERIAQIIQFTSTERMGGTTSGQMAATVNWFDHQGKDPGSSVTVRDPLGQFPDVHSGAKGTAEYDNHNGYYRVISSQRVALFAIASLTADTCGGTMSITSFSVRSTGDYIGTPPTSPTTVANPCGHAGVSGDAVLLRRKDNSMPEPAWEVIDVTKHAITVDVDQRVNGTEIQHKQRTIYVEFCDATPPEWVAWHEGDVCE